MGEAATAGAVVEVGGDCAGDRFIHRFFGITPEAVAQAARQAMGHP